MTKLSIVIPVYFNEKNIRPLYDDMKEKALQDLDCEYELVFVDDGSKDNSYQELCELQKREPNIKIIKLSRNFGSHAAILAGFEHCTGDCAMIKAADLQEPSELILQMYESWKKGNNVVLAVREDRKDGKMQKMFADTYYSLMRKFAIPDMPKGGFDCCLIDRRVIDVLAAMEEKNTTIMGQILWCGFKRDMIYYVREERTIGESKWTMRKKIKLAFDSVFGFSYFPVKLLLGVGIGFAVFALIWGIIIIVQKLMGSIQIAGWSAFMVVVLFTSGLILLGLGIIGEYLWRAFDAARKRPVYIVEDEKNED